MAYGRSLSAATGRIPQVTVPGARCCLRCWGHDTGVRAAPVNPMRAPVDPMRTPVDHVRAPRRSCARTLLARPQADCPRSALETPQLHNITCVFGCKLTVLLRPNSPKNRLRFVYINSHLVVLVERPCGPSTTAVTLATTQSTEPPFFKLDQSQKLPTHLQEFGFLKNTPQDLTLHDWLFKT